MLICGDARAIPLRDESVDCIVTSPPYWGLRDYKAQGQIGLEKTPEEFLETIQAVGRELWRILRPAGTLWVNMGDSYAQDGGPGWQGKNGLRADRRFTTVRDSEGFRARSRKAPFGLKPKDLMGMPWRVAFALQADGWWLRSDVVWNKPNPMPESATDRPTKSHDYVFLFAKAERYFFDMDAVKEPASPDSHARYARGRSDSHKRVPGVNPIAKTPSGWKTGDGDHRSIEGRHRNRGVPDDPRGSADRRRSGLNDARVPGRSKQNESFSASVVDLVESRNIRSVWTIPTQPYPGAHYATFPEELARRCILAGSPPLVCNCGAPYEPVVDVEYRNDTTTDGRPARGNHREEAEGETSTFASGVRTRRIATHLGHRRSCKCEEGVGARRSIVFDPFCGSGTTVRVARALGRDGIGLDVSEEYLSKQARYRVQMTTGFEFA